MTDKELKRLSRSELLELLLEQKRENEQLCGRVAALTKQMENYRITCEEAGTMAEAAVALNNVFMAADRAAKQYLLAVQEKMESQDKVLNERMEESRLKVESLLEDARVKSAEILDEAQKRKKDLETAADIYAKEAKEEADTYKRKITTETIIYAEKTRKEADNCLENAKAEAKAILEKANTEANEYWSKANEKIQVVLESQQFLKELFKTAAGK